MEVLSEILFWYITIAICVYTWLMIDDYLLIKKYGKETFNNFSPLDFKAHIAISILWPIFLMFGVFILFQKFFGEYK